MKIAMLASEAAPYIKSGGLGDVMQGLPNALAKENSVVLLLPYYQKLREDPALEVEFQKHLYVSLGWRQQYCGIWKEKSRAGGVQVYFIDNLQYFGSRSAIYGEPDDGERFAFFSKACLDSLIALDFIPDVIQCNDWQTAAAPLYLSAQYYPCFPGTKWMLTIHNAQYQGWADRTFFDDVLALPEDYRGAVEHNGAVNLLKGGIETSHLVTTVSETYARQLTDAAYAHGLERVLSANAHKLTGITNGIDVNTFDPATDPNLPENFSAKAFKRGKALCKAALQKEVGLPQKKDTPLLVMVSRLVEHKGLDLLQEIAPRLLPQDCQLVILGTGEGRYEEFFRDLAAEYPQQVAAKITFDLGLAARIYGGGDIYLMPSKSEPCGLSQMNAMRYGAVPVVHATGGLRDTVPGAEENGENGLGFTFQSYDPEDFYDAVGRCIRLYQNNRPAFQALQKRCLSQDFSWEKPARKYTDLFHHMQEQL